MEIDKKTYKIKSDNHYKTRLVKNQIILGVSLRKDHNHITRLQHKDYGKSKKWNTFTVSRDGEIFQHYNEKHHTDFIGIKDVDKKAISIVLENMGCLFEVEKEKYLNWLNEECDKDVVIKRNWLTYSFWEKFTDEQIESTILLLRHLCEVHSIPEKIIDFHHYHKDTVKYRGIVFRSNYIENSSDLTPMFDIPKFNEMLHNKFI